MTARLTPPGQQPATAREAAAEHLRQARDLVRFHRAGATCPADRRRCNRVLRYLANADRRLCDLNSRP